MKENANVLLITSSNRGDVTGIRKALRADADVHRLDDYALRWTASKGYKECVRVLLNAGADVHPYNDSALRHAVVNQHRETAKLLIEAGADFSDGCALRVATQNEDKELIQLLKKSKRRRKGER